MDRRKAGYILLLILALPSLMLPASASTGNPISNFANNLLLIIPPILFIMSLLALRQAEYDYAFTLLLASIIVTVALSAFQAQLNSHGLLFYTVKILVAGPTTTTVNTEVSYSVHQESMPSGFTIQSSNYNWVILYNYSIVVYNSSSPGQTNTQYISNPSASNNSLSFTPKQPGVYVVLYSITYKGTDSGIPAYAIGSGGIQLQVSPPLSGWNWFTNAVMSAITSFITNYLGSFISISSLIGGVVLDILSYALMSPTIGWPWNYLVTPIYNEILQTSIGLALLLIAGTVAYNALKNNYSDLIDIASDLLYKIGVWLLFTFGGLEIYNYSAIFINDLIQNILYQYAPLFLIELEYGVSIWIDLTAIGVIPFFAGDLKTFVGESLYAFAIAGTLIIVRYFMILAIVALIPLLSTLWIFEWTRKIADALVDILIGLMLAGLINTLLLDFFIVTGGIIFFFLLPYVVDLGTIASVMFIVFTIKPHERLGIPTGRSKGGSSSNNQPPQNQPPQAPPPPQQNKPSGSPTTYI